MSTKTIWLHLLREGGRWSTGEVAKATDFPGTKYTLPIMATAGSVVRYGKGKPGDRVTYGVTKDCRVPMGVTLAELMAIGVVKESS